MRWKFILIGPPFQVCRGRLVQLPCRPHRTHATSVYSRSAGTHRQASPVVARYDSYWWTLVTTWCTATSPRWPAPVGRTCWPVWQAPIEQRHLSTKTPFCSLGIRPMSLISSQDRREMLHKFSTFMFVRHPFDRLISAYIDKFTTTSRFTVYFHKRYGCRIIKLFRANYTKGDLQKCNDVTFKEFVKYLIHLYQTGGSFEPHWRPFHELCDPCHVPYDFIGKMETMSMDKTFVLRNFFNTTEPSLPRRNSKGGHHKPYLDEITPEEKDMLYEVYKQDFLLFGYDKGV